MTIRSSIALVLCAAVVVWIAGGALSTDLFPFMTQTSAIPAPDNSISVREPHVGDPSAREFDFGEVSAGETLTHVFDWKSPRNVPLEVDFGPKIRKSCGCVRADASLVANGIQLDVSIPTGAMRGDVAERVEVDLRYRDGATLAVPFVITACVVPQLKLEPEAVFLDDTIPDRALSVEVVAKVSRDADWGRSAWRGVPAACRVRLKHSSAREACFTI